MRKQSGQNSLGFVLGILISGCFALVSTNAAAQLRRPPADPDGGVVAPVAPTPAAGVSSRGGAAPPRLDAFQANVSAAPDTSVPRQKTTGYPPSVPDSAVNNLVRLPPSAASPAPYSIAASESRTQEFLSAPLVPRREPVLPSESTTQKPMRQVRSVGSAKPVNIALPAAPDSSAASDSPPQARNAEQSTPQEGVYARSFDVPAVLPAEDPRVAVQPVAVQPAAVAIQSPFIPKVDPLQGAKKTDGTKSAPSAPLQARIQADAPNASGRGEGAAGRDSAKPEGGKAAPQKPESATTDPDRVVFVVDQDLRQFLIDFSRRFGLRSDVAQSVRGRLTKVKLPVDPTALLKELEKRFDLEWLIEGDLLKVTSRSDLATRIIPLGSLTYEEVIRELKVVDIDTSRYPLRKLSESNAVITTAPTGHIGRMAALIDALRAGKSVGPDLRIVKFGASQKVVWD